MKQVVETSQTDPNQPLYDVIISGAGPVGLFLAGELALAKCTVLILEKAESPQSTLKQLPFGIRGLNAPSIESLDRRGMLDKLEIHKRLKNPHLNSGQGAGRQVGHFAGIPFLEGNVDTSMWPYRLPGSTEPSLISEMEEMESILGGRAQSLGVSIIRGAAITGFQQTEQEVRVQTGIGSYRAKWLVGCDGSRSVVRRKGGFDFAGTEPEFTGYTAKVDIADPEKLKPGRNLMPTGMYLQSQPGYLTLQDFDGGAFHSSEKTVTKEHLQETLRRISETDVTLSALHIATTWTDRARQATAYRNKRVLLAGDAAHIHAPLGGQGLNLGLGDAMNLGWKLAATIHHIAPEGLLDTYYAERFPLGMQVLDWSRSQVAVMKPGPTARALNAIVRDLMDTRDGATYFAARVWGINTRYATDCVHPLVGRSVPQFEMEDGETVSGLLQGGRGILLDFTTNAELRAMTENYGDQVQYVSGRAKETLGLNAILIRPDGIVAWLADTHAGETGFQQAADRWFVRR